MTTDEMSDQTISEDAFNDFIMTWVKAVQKAWDDPAFHGSLTSNPQAALKQAFGYDLPRQLDISVGDERRIGLTLVIPPKGSDLDFDRGIVGTTSLASLLSRIQPKLC